MNYWLIKSEPDEFSWDDLVKDGKSIWTGVRNYRARNNLKEMKVGDLAFYYHSNVGKEIVGVAKVTKEFYQDPTEKIDRKLGVGQWVVVDFSPVKKLNKPVTLEEIKMNPKFSNMELVKLSRLSVSSVSKGEWDAILKLSDTSL